jgi:HAD superfamily hydrolase (TIGR01484 family)
MRYAALSVDYDGTLPSSAGVAPATVRALQRLAPSGRKLLLVTGRELEELLAVFPECNIFDRIVAENGAVLYTPKTQTRRALGDPPSPELVRELERRGVQPLSVGRSIVATVHPHETTALEAIRDLGLELNVIFNKGAVMILPASLNKASGLAAALDDLGLSARNVAAIGDAENDHALLRASEFGVAVANALPTLKQEADRTSGYENGRAVVELVDDLISHDLRATPPRALRREILLGTRADGGELRIPPAWFNLLIAGAAGRRRATLANGVLGRIAAAGYQFCGIDATGDHAGMPGAIMLGAAGRPPAAADVMTALHKPDANVMVHLGSVPLQARPAFFADLLRRLQDARARVGRPHWILVDELQQILPEAGYPLPKSLTDAPSGMMYVTADPDQIAEQVLATVDLAVALGAMPRATLRGVAASWGVAPPDLQIAALDEGEALAWRRTTNGPPLRIRIAPSGDAP